MDNSIFQKSILDKTRSDRVIEWLKSGDVVLDGGFDRVLPIRYQKMSSVHWSRISVIRRVVELAELNSKSTVLDIGSGVGKFCIVGALISEATFVGVEQRKHLVDAASEIVVQQNIPRVRFLHRNAFEVGWSDFDVVYLYNPFLESINAWIRMDESVPFGQAIYDACIESTRKNLEQLRSGTKVIVYNGFGGDMPESFSLNSSEACPINPLELWTKK